MLTKFQTLPNENHNFEANYISFLIARVYAQNTQINIINLYKSHVRWMFSN